MGPQINLKSWMVFPLLGGANSCHERPNESCPSLMATVDPSVFLANMCFVHVFKKWIVVFCCFPTNINGFHNDGLPGLQLVQLRPQVVRLGLDMSPCVYVYHIYMYIYIYIWWILRLMVIYHISAGLWMNIKSLRYQISHGYITSYQVISVIHICIYGYIVHIVYIYIILQHLNYVNRTHGHGDQVI